MVRVQQIDDLLLVLVNVPAGTANSPEAIAREFCSIGETTPPAANRS